MALFRINIEWTDDSHNVLVYKYPFKNGGREVNNRSTLTVRESQMAVFVYKGQICDVFAPGFYKLDTNIYPILTKLAAWTYGFQTPITMEVYFINTKQFTGNKWGTQNPILMRDPEFGSIRVRGFGQFAFKVDDCGAFLRELFGTNSTFTKEDILEHLRGLVVSHLTDAIGESKLSAIDLAGNTIEFQQIVTETVQEGFKDIGLQLTKFVIENMSVPPEVEKAFDERSRLGILGDKTDVMMRMAAADALKEAAKNPGMGGAFMSAGVGLGAGAGLGQMMNEAFKQPQQPQPQQPQQQAAAAGAAAATAGGAVCHSCGAAIPAGSKFCPVCGEKQNVKRFCPECGKEVAPGAKFCPECGMKLQ
ncbi:MAG: SPFH domain-containing protein [Clostridia bacterium]|nr:SPFH domain-containing protein [Clostridia bacterium]